MLREEEIKLTFLAFCANIVALDSGIKHIFNLIKIMQESQFWGFRGETPDFLEIFEKVNF